MTLFMAEIIQRSQIEFALLTVYFNKLIEDITLLEDSYFCNQLKFNEQTKTFINDKMDGIEAVINPAAQGEANRISKTTFNVEVLQYKSYEEMKVCELLEGLEKYPDSRAANIKQVMESLTPQRNFEEYFFKYKPRLQGSFIKKLLLGEENKVKGLIHYARDTQKSYFASCLSINLIAKLMDFSLNSQAQHYQKIFCSLDPLIIAKLNLDIHIMEQSKKVPYIFDLIQVYEVQNQFGAKASDFIEDISALNEYDKWKTADHKNNQNGKIQFDKRQSMLNFRVETEQFRGLQLHSKKNSAKGFSPIRNLTPEYGTKASSNDNDSIPKSEEIKATESQFFQCEKNLDVVHRIRDEVFESRGQGDDYCIQEIKEQTFDKVKLMMKNKNKRRGALFIQYPDISVQYQTSTMDVIKAEESTSFLTAYFEVSSIKIQFFENSNNLLCLIICLFDEETQTIVEDETAILSVKVKEVETGEDIPLLDNLEVSMCVKLKQPEKIKTGLENFIKSFS